MESVLKMMKVFVIVVIVMDFILIRPQKLVKNAINCVRPALKKINSATLAGIFKLNQ